MNSLHTESPASLWLRDRCIRLITVGVVLALLYVGRVVLIPLVLAIMLSLLVAPCVRALRRVGVGRTPSVLSAVTTLSITVLAVASVLGMQVLHIADSLPQYKATIQRKLAAVDTATAGQLAFVTNEANRLLETDDFAGQ